MSDIAIGYIMAGFTLGMLIGVVLARGVEIYRKKRGWDD